jgi:hypothetical protein
MVAGDPLLASASPLRRVRAGVVAARSWSTELRKAFPASAVHASRANQLNVPYLASELLSDGRSDPGHVNDCHPVVAVPIASVVAELAIAFAESSHGPTVSLDASNHAKAIVGALFTHGRPTAMTGAPGA